jgi:hypothetical protein
VNYKNAKIYQILNYIDDDVYVGSTTQPLFKRCYEHKIRLNNEKFNTLLYQKISETNLENWYIEVYE